MIFAQSLRPAALAEEVGMCAKRSRARVRLLAPSALLSTCYESRSAMRTFSIAKSTNGLRSPTRA